VPPPVAGKPAPSMGKNRLLLVIASLAILVAIGILTG
jgi:hypothetical protein